MRIVQDNQKLGFQKKAWVGKKILKKPLSFEKKSEFKKKLSFENIWVFLKKNPEFWKKSELKKKPWVLKKRAEF